MKKIIQTIIFFVLATSILHGQNNTEDKTYFKKSGFINLTEINYCHGIGTVYYDKYSATNTSYSFGFRTVNGSQVNKNTSLGIGIGIDKYDYQTLLPITFDARVTALKGKVCPVFTANVGYAVGLNNANGGIAFNPQIGFKIFISENIAYLINIGYKYQAVETDSYTGSQIANFQFITISTGFAF